MRIGLGYDVHKLVEGRALILGGLKFDYPKGLLGHSDADVLTHAIEDAILGALNLGDIGKLFPDTDPKYKDASSVKMLDKVVSMMEDKGYKIGNLDTVIICEEPKIGPKSEEIKEILAGHLHCEKDQVSIKASTSEGLGFTGKGQGIEVRAIVLLQKA